MNWFTRPYRVPSSHGWHFLFSVFYTISHGFGTLPVRSHRPVKVKRNVRPQQDNWQY
ncbi:MAG: hypothetical protein NW218_20050 [Saprospiraceae bacterium]|nr:hypothetical protein [Saprospiraceae bacterium]